MSWNCRHLYLIEYPGLAPVYETYYWDVLSKKWFAKENGQYYYVSGGLINNYGNLSTYWQLLKNTYNENNLIMHKVYYCVSQNNNGVSVFSSDVGSGSPSTILSGISNASERIEATENFQLLQSGKDSVEKFGLIPAPDWLPEWLINSTSGKSGFFLAYLLLAGGVYGCYQEYYKKTGSTLLNYTLMAAGGYSGVKLIQHKMSKK